MAAAAHFRFHCSTGKHWAIFLEIITQKHVKMAITSFNGENIPIQNKLVNK